MAAEIAQLQTRIDRVRVEDQENGRKLDVGLKPIVIKTADQLAGHIETAVWLLEPYLEKNSSVLMYGDLGTLKSFLALHWALECALLGHPVLYLSAEGKGLGKRLKGWARDRYGEGWEAALRRLPFMGIEQPLNLSAELIVGHL